MDKNESKMQKGGEHILGNENSRCKNQEVYKGLCYFRCENKAIISER